jgi:hypothetical protein
MALSCIQEMLAIGSVDENLLLGPKLQPHHLFSEMFLLKERIMLLSLHLIDHMDSGKMQSNDVPYFGKGFICSQDLCVAAFAVSLELLKS